MQAKFERENKNSDGIKTLLRNKTGVYAEGLLQGAWFLSMIVFPQGHTSLHLTFM